MSELARAVKAVDTGVRVSESANISPLLSDVFAGRVDICSAIPPVDGIVYSIGVELGSRVVITDRLALTAVEGETAISEAVHRTKRQIIEAVFGEFRPHFRRIEREIYNRNYQRAGELLAQMEKQMFDME